MPEKQLNVQKMHEQFSKQSLEPKKHWYEKDCEEWDENDEFDALCDLFETYH